MVATDSFRKKIINRSGLIVIFIALLWGLAMVYFGTHAPTTPDPAGGRIYEYNYHGSVVYLNLTEQVLLYALPGIGISIMIILSWVDSRLRKHNRQWPPDEGDC